MTSKWFTSLTCGVALIGVTLTGAFPVSAAEPAPDKSGPGVARVSIIQGSAVVQRGDSHTQTSAVRNAPLLPGDYISTGNTSRAELQFDGTTAVRLGGNVQARITNDDPNNRRLQLADGTVEMGMVRDGQSMQIDTPSVGVRSNRTGDYRVSIAKDGSSWVTVRRGHVDVVTPQRTYGLDEGRTLVARGSASHPSITYTTAAGYDTFDDFNAKRDQAMLAALNSSPNLNPSIAGYDNLDQYGQWRDVAGYGEAWVPQQNADWAPYRNGSWVWEGGYGWTWVGSEPWGWAPYHYGRWFYANGYGWAWYPPAYASTPVWSPALVGFFGFGIGFGGPGWGVSIGVGDGGYGGYPYGGGYGGYGCGYGGGYGGYPYGGGYGGGYGGYPYGGGNGGYPYGGGYGGYGYGGGYGGYPGGAGYGYGGYPGFGYGNSCYPYVGWIPLAPYETFYPWYPGWSWTGFGWGWPTLGFGSIYRTRIVNVTNIYNVYRNFRHGGGSGTLVGNFRHGTISGRTIPVTSRNLGKRIGSIRGGLPLAPNRNNLGFGGRALNRSVAFSRTFNSPRFASNRAIAARMPFDRQQRMVTQAIRINAIAARHQAVPVTRNNALTRNNAGTRPVPVTRNAPGTRNVPVTPNNAEAGRREVTPVTRQNAVTPAHENTREAAPSQSWERFNEARGVQARSAEPAARLVEGTARSERVTPATGVRQTETSVAPREQRAPVTDSWGRFSQQRGGVAAPVSNERPASTRESAPSYSREAAPSYSRGESTENPYARNTNTYERNPSNTYERNPSNTYERNPYSAPQRESMPSYARPSYGNAPSYSRGSYGAPPSYSRGSYGAPPSYSRGSAPSAPSRPSGGSGGGGGGGGQNRGGGDHHGRPPQTQQ